MVVMGRGHALRGRYAPIGKPPLLPDDGGDKIARLDQHRSRHGRDRAGGSSPALTGCGPGRDAVRLPKLLLILCVCAAGPAAAGPLEDAIAASDTGDYATAIRLWRPLADQGNARAQYALGNIYRLGRGVPQDLLQAYVWYSLSAARGVESAKVRRNLVAARMSPEQVERAQQQLQELVTDP